MTFLCGPDRDAGVAQHERGVGWPQPWVLRCDGCGAEFAYADCGHLIEQTGADEHTCTGCKATAATGQLRLMPG